MEFHRPKGLFAGFHAVCPDPKLPELVDVGEQWAPAEFFISEHTHAAWEFYFQVDGESRWICDGKIRELKPGGFFAVGPGIKHRMRERPKQRHHFLFAVIDIAEICKRHANLRSYWRNRNIIFDARGEALQPPFRLLIREVSTALPHRTNGMRSALDYLVIEATRLLEPSRKGGSFIASHPAVMRAKEILDRHSGERWKLAELARLAGLSPSRLSECFTHDTGMSPHQYLIRVRIERAKEALKQSDVSITDLAMDLGFSSSQHFASVFKRMTGITAQKYRKRGLPVESMD